MACVRPQVGFESRSLTSLSVRLHSDCNTVTPLAHSNGANQGEVLHGSEVLEYLTKCRPWPDAVRSPSATQRRSGLLLVRERTGGRRLARFSVP